MLNSKLTQLKHHFGIFADSDWCSVEPSWILRQPGIGPKTLDYIRVLLAARDLTLKGDRTPDYWRANLPDAQVLETMGDDDEGQDRGAIAPFTILIDTAEQQPFTFLGLRTDTAGGNRPLIVPMERVSLGRHPDSLGDYTLSSGQGRCHVERKSMADAHGTFLGWDSGRRERFECELQNLSDIESGLVVVECSLAALITLAPATKKPASVNAKILSRSILAWTQDYKVRWLFADSPRMAEVMTFRFFERWHRKRIEQGKESEKRFREAVGA